MSTSGIESTSGSDGESGSAPPFVWSIAGSDSGGGAGIQADLLTMHDLGVHGCTVITANTAQNTIGVSAINAVPLAVLTSQLEALRADLKPSAIKIGLLAGSDQVRCVAGCLRALRARGNRIPVVFDPVALASSGARLTDECTAEAILQELLPLCDVITPNRHELTWLITALDLQHHDAQQPVVGESAADICAAACTLRDRFPALAVMVTGGHSPIEEGVVADLLCCGGGANAAIDWLLGTRISARNTHGTGCTLSSAIAALLAKGYPIKDACIVASAYVRRGLRLGSLAPVGAGPGPVGHCGWPTSIEDFPAVLAKGDARAKRYGCFDAAAATNLATGFAPPDTNQLGLYPVVDSVEWLDRLAQVGVRTLQLRIKQPDRDLRQKIVAAVAIGRRYDLRLFINDYWQLAIECGAYGVHLGQEDLQRADLKAIQCAGLKLGISTHGFFELLLARQYRPSYLAIGAIFPTNTKDMRGQLQGVEKLARMAALLSNYPLVAIGGINAARAPAVVAAGVGSIAVVSAITEAQDYRQAVARLNNVLHSQRTGLSEIVES